jgi:hypothetical protein
MIRRMNGVNKVIISVGQNDTSVFLVGDIYDLTTKSQIYDNYARFIRFMFVVLEMVI